jgi:hypothetical protein
MMHAGRAHDHLLLVNFNHATRHESIMDANASLPPSLRSEQDQAASG